MKKGTRDFFDLKKNNYAKSLKQKSLWKKIMTKHCYETNFMMKKIPKEKYQIVTKLKKNLLQNSRTHIVKKKV